MPLTEKRELLLRFRSRLQCRQKIAANLERQLPESQTPQELGEWEEMSEARIGETLGMLAGYLQETLAEACGEDGTVDGEGSRWQSKEH